MDKKNIKKKIEEQGYFHINVLFEIIGNPKEHVQKAIKIVLSKIKENEKIIVTKEEFGDAQETTDGYWGVFCETELLVPDIYTITWIAFNYTPAAIEILEPSKITFKDKDLSDMMNDLLGRLHESNTHQIELSSLNKALEKNINAILRNTIQVALGNKELTSADIGSLIGMTGKDLEPVLEAMIKEKTIEKNGSKYKRIFK